MGKQTNHKGGKAATRALEINKQEAKFTTNHHVIDIHSLDEALEHIQPYTIIDEKGCRDHPHRLPRKR